MFTNVHVYLFTVMTFAMVSVSEKQKTCACIGCDFRYVTSQSYVYELPTVRETEDTLLGLSLPYE